MKILFYLFLFRRGRYSVSFILFIFIFKMNSFLGKGDKSRSIKIVFRVGEIKCHDKGEEEKEKWR